MPYTLATTYTGDLQVLVDKCEDPISLMADLREVNDLKLDSSATILKLYSSFCFKDSDLLNIATIIPAVKILNLSKFPVDTLKVGLLLNFLNALPHPPQFIILGDYLRLEQRPTIEQQQLDATMSEKGMVLLGNSPIDYAVQRHALTTTHSKLPPPLILVIQEYLESDLLKRYSVPNTPSTEAFQMVINEKYRLKNQSGEAARAKVLALDGLNTLLIQRAKCAPTNVQLLNKNKADLIGWKMNKKCWGCILKSRGALGYFNPIATSANVVNSIYELLDIAVNEDVVKHAHKMGKP